MHIAAVQLDIVWEDKPANHARIESMLDAVDLPPDTLVILPELADTGFSFNLKRIVDDRTLDWAVNLARTRHIWVQAGYASLGPDQRGRNCMTIIAPDGSTCGTYQKIHPFSYGARETEFFTGGNHLFLHRCPDALVSPIICYDLRFPELFRLAAIAGAEVFTLGASWPDARQTHWRALLIARAIENQAYVLGVNRTGTDPHLSYAGGSIIVSPKGDILAEAGTEETVLHAELDIPALRDWRADFPALRDIKPHLLGSLDIHRS
jgi:omega-amidase